MLHPYKFSGGKVAGIIIPVPVKGLEPPTCLRLLAGGHPDQRLTTRPLTPTGLDNIDFAENF